MENSKSSRSKLRELILYIGHRCESNLYLRDLVLNECIVFIEVQSYLQRQELVTGSNFVKKAFGVTPMHLLDVLKQMIEERDIVIKKGVFGVKYQQHRIITLRPANVDQFKTRDLMLIEDVLYKCSNDGVQSISSTSRGAAWKLAALGAVIPHEAFVLADNQALAEAEI